MKKITILLVGILCLGACKKSSDSLPVTSASLSGTWVRQYAVTTLYTNGAPTKTTDTSFNTTGNSLSNLNLYIYFSSDLSGTYLEPGINGIPFTYAITGRQLILNFGNATDLQTNYTIKSVTSTHLELVDGTATGNETVYDITYLKNQ